MRRFLLGVIIPASFLIIWEGSSQAGLLTLELLSRPSDILVAGYAALRDGSLLARDTPDLRDGAAGTCDRRRYRDRRRRDPRPFANSGAYCGANNRGTAADPGHRLYAAGPHGVRFRRPTGSEHRCLCLRLADPHRDDRGCARGRGTPARSGCRAGIATLEADDKDRAAGGLRAHQRRSACCRGDLAGGRDHR